MFLTSLYDKHKVETFGNVHVEDHLDDVVVLGDAVVVRQQAAHHATVAACRG